MAEHFNKLTPAEAELLAVLAEECGEIVQIVGKILRHGFDSWNPNDRLRTTNRTMLAKEIGDFLHAYNRLASAECVNPDDVDEFERAKADSIVRYLHHQQPSEVQP